MYHPMPSSLKTKLGYVKVFNRLVWILSLPASSPKQSSTENMTFLPGGIHTKHFDQSHGSSRICGGKNLWK